MQPFHLTLDLAHHTLDDLEKLLRMCDGGLLMAIAITTEEGKIHAHSSKVNLFARLGPDDQHTTYELALPTNSLQIANAISLGARRMVLTGTPVLRNCLKPSPIRESRLVSAVAYGLEMAMQQRYSSTIGSMLGFAADPRQGFASILWDDGILTPLHAPESEGWCVFGAASFRRGNGMNAAALHALHIHPDGTTREIVRSPLFWEKELPNHGFTLNDPSLWTSVYHDPDDTDKASIQSAYFIGERPQGTVYILSRTDGASELLLVQPDGAYRLDSLPFLQGRTMGGYALGTNRDINHIALAYTSWQEDQTKVIHAMLGQFDEGPRKILAEAILSQAVPALIHP